MAELSEVMAETQSEPDPVELGIKVAKLLDGLKVGEIEKLELIPNV